MNFPVTAPLLSVCIPTYNRAPLLREALEAVAAQGDADLFASVEVSVSDNASADDTEPVVREFAACHPEMNLRYHRHPESVSPDRNILGVAMQARGEFVWILGDDDLVLPGALAKLLSLIREHPEMGAFCLNLAAFTHTLADLEPPAFSLREDRALADPNEALEFLGTWITFLSVLAFRREILLKQDYLQRTDTNILQAYPFLDALSASKTSWAVREPLLAVRTGNTSGYSFFKVFVTQFSQMLDYAEQNGYSAASVGRVRVRHLKKFVFSCIVTNKLRGSAGRSVQDYGDGARRLLAAYGLHPFVAGVLIPLMLTPAWLLKPLRPLGQRVKKMLRRGRAR